MSDFGNQFLSQLQEGDNVRDYQHAARTFVDGTYRLSPKYQSLFHIYIELNPVVATPDGQNPNSKYELGLLAKTVTLPKFTIQNKTLNAYNRKNIVQERINYDPVTFTFHDDSSNVVRNFWQNYYRYYYRDSDHSDALYNAETKYKQRQEQKWGFSPNGSQTQNYINSITVYSLHQKSFSSYTLIRPTITSFQHGQHTQGEYEPLEHLMTVSYEAVKYASGRVSSTSVKGFAESHYDKTPSPLTSVGGGTRSFLGPGGLVEGVSDAINDLQSGNWGSAALGILRTSNNFKNADLKTIASAEIKQLGVNVLKGQNTQSTVFVPTISSAVAGVSKAVNSIPGLTGSTRTNTVTNMNTQNQASTTVGLSTGYFGGVF